MKVVLVKERDTIRVLEGKGNVSENELSLRSRLTGGDIEYYELKVDESLGMRLDAYVEAIKRHPNLLNTSKLIKRI